MMTTAMTIISLHQVAPMEVARTVKASMITREALTMAALPDLHVSNTSI